MSSSDETVRAVLVLRGQTLEGEPRRGGQVWLIGNRRIRTTLLLTSQEAGQLARMLRDASSTGATR